MPTNTMAIPGQRFELDLDADNWTFDPVADGEAAAAPEPSVIKEIQEHDVADVPAPPKIKQTQSGFPEHKSRRNVSSFKQKQEAGRKQHTVLQSPTMSRSSDAAIMNRVANKYGYDPVSKEKAEISKENERRIAEMSAEDIQEARAELMQSLNPALVERLLRRANIDEDPSTPSHSQPQSTRTDGTSLTEPDDRDDGSTDTLHQDEMEKPGDDMTTPLQPSKSTASSLHFPVPPNDSASYKPLDPSSDTFLMDLKNTYFPNLTHTPSTLSWLDQSTPSTEPTSHSYAPNLTSYPASSLRFNFAGSSIPPSTALSIPVTAGMHHHGNAPDSAGYTIPELTLLTRSTLPSQRCIAYQTVGRMLFRLGKGDFGHLAASLMRRCGVRSKTRGCWKSSWERQTLRAGMQVQRHMQRRRCGSGGRVVVGREA